MIEPEVTRIIDALSNLRMPAQPEEYDIHAQLASALGAASIPYEHEYKLGPRCRIDFRVGRVGIEVKKGRPVLSDLKKQLKRYLESDALSAVIVVTQRAVSLPPNLSGKPVYTVSLNRLWGVALP